MFSQATICTGIKLTSNRRWSLGILIFEMLAGFTPFWDSGSPLKIYENILKGRVKYPPYIHPDAQDLLGKLITADLTKRLGNLHGGSRDVMTHPWFAEVTWERLAKKDIDAPYVPPVRGGAGDASLFDKYPEETEQYGATGDDAYVPVPPPEADSFETDRLQTWQALPRLLSLDQITGSKLHPVAAATYPTTRAVMTMKDKPKFPCHDPKKDEQCKRLGEVFGYARIATGA